MGIMQGQETEYKPWGMSAGNMVGKREADIDAANMLELQQSQLGNVIKSIEAERASADFNDPRMEALRQQGIMGKDQSASAAGQLAMGTLNTGIAAGNSKNRASGSEDENKTLLNGLQRVSTDLDALLQGGGQYGPASYQNILRQMPPEFQQIGSKMQPQQFKGFIDMVTDKFKSTLADSPAVRGKITEQNNQYENQEVIHGGDRDSRLQVGREQNASQERIAAMRAAQAAAKNSQLSYIQQAVKKGNYQAAAVAFSVMAMNEPDETLKAQYTQQAAMYEQMDKQARAAGAVKPNAIDFPAVAQLPGQQQSPSLIGGQGGAQPGARPPIGSFNR